MDILLGTTLLENIENFGLAFVLDISEKKKSEAALQKSYDREILLRKILEMINRSFDIDQVLSYTNKEVCQFFNADRCLLVLYDNETSASNGPQPAKNYRLRIYDQYCRDKSIVPLDINDVPAQLLYPFQPEMDAGGQHSTLTINYSSPQDFPEFYIPFSNKYQLQSVLGVQIYHHNVPYGRIVLHQCTSPRAWKAEEIELLSLIAASLGVALYQAELFKKEQVARQDAEIAHQQKSQFLATVSHELRTPLNTIIGYSEMLEAGYAGPLNDKQSKYAKNVATSGHHLLEMVNDILDVSRIKAGQVSVSLQPIKIQAMMKDIEKSFRQMALAQHVHLAFHVHPGLDKIVADRVRIKQIFMHLVSNAIKFNRPGGEVNVKLSISPNNQWMLCDVMDTGIGIPKDKQDELFTDFYQVDNSFSRRHEGAGIGLALTKRFVELHGGSISIESIEYVGTRISFRLPLKRQG